MPTVTSIQIGSKTILREDGLDVTETISPVNPSRTIVMMTARNNDNQGRLRRHEFQAELTNATTITFRRNESASSNSVYVEYTVVDFDSGEIASIQKGSAAIATDPEDVPISPITIADTIPIWHLETNSLGQSGDAIPTVQFTTTTNMQFDYRVSPNAGNIAYYYVVEFNAADITIQSGEIALANTDTTKTAPVTAVDQLKTLISHGGARIAWGSSASRGMAQLHFTADNIIEASRSDDGTTQAMDASYHVLEFDDHVTVEVGESTIADLGTSVNPTFTELGADSCAWNANWLGNAWVSSASNNDSYKGIKCSQLLAATPDDLTIERRGTSKPIETAYYLPDFTAAAAAPFLPYYDKRPDVLLRM